MVSPKDYPSNRDFVLEKIGEIRELLDATEATFEGGMDLFDVRDAAQTFRRISMTSGVLAASLAETIDARTKPRQEDDGKGE